jgi:hypothetical protein
MSVFKLMRVVALLSILFVLVVGTWMTERRLASWERPIWVTIYPLVADEGEDTWRFAESIEVGDFDAVNEFMAREGRPYGVLVTPPFFFQLADIRTQLPPEMPDQYSPVGIAWWSLKARWWAWRQDFNDGLVEPDIQMFVIFHGKRTGHEVEISVGMRKGRYGVVNAFAQASMHSRNLVVFTHELMHVLGATDKYTRSTGEPVYPFGFADPRQSPLFPQKRAEIMGGRIPLNAFESIMPAALDKCKIGQLTATEIGYYNQLIE